jgi:hypothetical protein
MRIGIRSRAAQGARSFMTVGAANFSVNLQTLPVPRIISPVQGGRYDSTVQIVVAADRLPDRSFYQFFYSSASTGIPVTSIGQQVLVRDIPLSWSTVTLPAAEDYVFYAGVVTYDGSMSDIVSVTGINVSHEGYFIIDTLPPIATLKIESGHLFTNNPTVSVSVYAYDAATGIQALQVSNNLPQPPKINTSVILASPDGVKDVTALVQDFGANRNSDVVLNPILINVMPVTNASVVDFFVSTFSGVTYINSVLLGTDSSTPNGLYELAIADGVVGFGRQLAPITDTPLACVAFNGDNFVATVDDDGVGRLLVEVISGWSTAVTLIAGEQIADIEVFNGVMYFGTNLGNLYSYDGSVSHLLTSGSDAIAEVGTLDITEFGRPPIRSLKTESGRLFLTFENCETIGIFTGTTLFYR